MISFDYTTGEQTWITPPQLQQSLGHVYPRCYSILFMRGRIRFLCADGKAKGSPAFASMLCAYSKADAESIIASGLQGAHFRCH